MQLRITEFAVSVSLGVYAWEKLRKRKVFINLLVDYTAEAGSDRLEATLDYDALAAAVRAAAQAKHYDLIETMLGAIGQAVLSFPRASRAEVEISKPGALPGARRIGISAEFAR